MTQHGPRGTGRVLDDEFIAGDAEHARFHAARAFARFVVLGIGCNPSPEGAAGILTSVGYSSGKAWAVLGQLCQSSDMPPASPISHQTALYGFQKATIARDPEGMFGLHLLRRGFGGRKRCGKVHTAVGFGSQGGPCGSHDDAVSSDGKF
jgi:hypothetical protein